MENYAEFCDLCGAASELEGWVCHDPAYCVAEIKHFDQQAAQEQERRAYEEEYRNGG